MASKQTRSKDEVGLAEKMLKAKTQNGAFYRYLKLFLGSWNC